MKFRDNGGNWGAVDDLPTVKIRGAAQRFEPGDQLEWFVIRGPSTRALRLLAFALCLPFVSFAEEPPAARLTNGALTAPDLHASPPEAVLRNGSITVRVWLPDAEVGYYRGPRFDWSGMVHRVEHDRHAFFGEWKSAPNPAATDNVVGTAGEFGMESPLGYVEAEPGGTFFKIGVGKLEREKSEPYKFSQRYKVAEPLPWETRRGESWIEFSQTLPETNGWGYEYAKRIELAEDAPALTIRYRLKNTGNKAISTDYYCHNFVVFDGRPLEPGVRVRVPFEAKERDIEGIARVGESGVELLQELPKGKSLFHKFDAFPATVDANEFWLENPHTGQSLHLRGDTPPAKLVFYGIGKAVCIEPFIDIRLAPGDEKHWADRYEFSGTTGPESGDR